MVDTYRANRQYERLVGLPPFYGNQISNDIPDDDFNGEVIATINYVKDPKTGVIDVQIKRFDSDEIIHV